MGNWVDPWTGELMGDGEHDADPYLLSRLHLEIEDREEREKEAWDRAWEHGDWEGDPE